MRMFLGIVSIFLLFNSMSSFAQDTGTQPAPTETETGIEELNEEDVVPELVFDDEPVSENENTTEELEQTGRFIPSEQISQDLGVSFPANI